MSRRLPFNDALATRPDPPAVMIPDMSAPVTPVTGASGRIAIRPFLSTIVRGA